MYSHKFMTMANKRVITEIIREKYGLELTEKQIKLIWSKILKLTKLIYINKSDGKYKKDIK